MPRLHSRTRIRHTDGAAGEHCHARPMLTAAFSLVSTERRVADDSRAATDALALAESGLERYLSRTRVDGLQRDPGRERVHAGRVRPRVRRRRDVADPSAGRPRCRRFT